MKTMNENKQTTPSINEIESAAYVYGNWSGRFLRSIMIGSLVFGLIALIPNVLQAPSKIYAALYLITYIALAIITFASIPYNVRAGTFLFLLYGLGVVGLTQDGLWGDARLFFLAFIGISLLLFTIRAGVVATILSLITLFSGELLITNGVITISNPEVDVVGSTGIWITSGTILLLLAVMFLAGLHILRQDFSKAQEQARTTLAALQKVRGDLEERVQERTSGLARKSELLRAASYISRQVATKQDFSSLLSSAVELITEQFSYYHAGIFLLNERGDQAILQAASSEGGKQLLKNGYSISLTKKTDPVAVAASKNKAQVALDFGENAVVFENPLLPATRSQIAIPIVLGNKTSGVLDIQSTESRAFIEGDIDVFQSLVDHIAIAIENARLLNETQTVLMQLKTDNIARTSATWDEISKGKTRAYTYTTLGIRPEKPTEEDVNSLKIPISLRGHEIGTITLSRKEGDDWDENDQNLATKVTSQVGLAMDNLHLLEEAQKNAAHDQTLTNVSGRIRETLDMESILQSAAHEFQRALNLKDAEIRLGAPDMLKNQDGSVSKIASGTLRVKTQRTSKKKTQ
jgi:GAF domain-containing protein